MAKVLYALYDENKRVFHVEVFGEWLKPICGTDLSNVWRCAIEKAVAMGKPLCSKCRRSLERTHRDIHSIMVAAGEWDDDE